MLHEHGSMNQIFFINARRIERMLKQEKKWKEKFEKSRKLSAIINFEAFGCKTIDDSSKVHLVMAEKKEIEVARSIQKKNDLLHKRQN